MNYDTNTVGSTNFFSLVMSYKDIDGGTKWEIFFQQKPHYRIYRKGAIPTRDEIIEILANTNYPISFIPILEIIFATCEVES